MHHEFLSPGITRIFSSKVFNWIVLLAIWSLPVAAVKSVHTPLRHGVGWHGPHSQSVPEYPLGHWHVVDIPVVWQTPPFMQAQDGAGSGPVPGQVPGDTSISLQQSYKSFLTLSQIMTLFKLIRTQSFKTQPKALRLYGFSPQHPLAPPSVENGNRVGNVPQHWSAGPLAAKLDLHDEWGSQP